MENWLRLIIAFYGFRLIIIIILGTMYYIYIIIIYYLIFTDTSELYHFSLIDI